MYGFLMLALFCCEAYSVESKAMKKKTADLGSRGQLSTIALSALILGIARSNPTCSIHKLSGGVSCFCVYHYVIWRVCSSWARFVMGVTLTSWKLKVVLCAYVYILCVYTHTHTVSFVPHKERKCFNYKERLVTVCRDTVVVYNENRTERVNTVMRRITTFRSTTDRIYDGGPIIL